MNIIYVHGLDSSSQSNKALALVDYVNKHEPSMTVHHPDLNMPPSQVRDKLLALVNKLNPVIGRQFARRIFFDVYQQCNGRQRSYSIPAPNHTKR